MHDDQRDRSREPKQTYRSRTGAEVRALAGVSFEIPRGRVYGLLGPNGAGKSTLVKILSTITAPTEGRAAVMGWT
ncbi:MAG: ATP-binding cassette domain-containing protein [Gammaproteobacteria bacterium]